MAPSAPPSSEALKEKGDKGTRMKIRTGMKYWLAERVCKATWKCLSWSIGFYYVLPNKMYSSPCMSCKQCLYFFSYINSNMHKILEINQTFLPQPIKWVRLSYVVFHKISATRVHQQNNIMKKNTRYLQETWCRLIRELIKYLFPIFPSVFTVHFLSPSFPQQLSPFYGGS